MRNFSRWLINIQDQEGWEKMEEYCFSFLMFYFFSFNFVFVWFPYLSTAVKDGFFFFCLNFLLWLAWINRKELEVQNSGNCVAHHSERWQDKTNEMMIWLSGFKFTNRPNILLSLCVLKTKTTYQQHISSAKIILDTAVKILVSQMYLRMLLLV